MYVFCADEWHVVSRDEMSYETPCGFSTIPDNPSHVVNKRPAVLCRVCESSNVEPVCRKVKR